MQQLARGFWLTSAAALSLLGCSGRPSGATAPGGGGSSGAGAATPGGGTSAGGSATAAGSAGATASGGGTGGAAGAGGTGVAGNPASSAGTAGNGGSSTAAGGGGPSAGASGYESGAGSAAGGASEVGSGCGGVSAKLCDDFEADVSGQAPQGDFNVAAKSGAIIVDQTRAYSGKQALHLSSAKPGSSSMLEFSKQFPLNDFYGRAMFYLTRIPSAEIHWDLLDATSQNSVHWEIGGMYGKFILVVDPPDHGLSSDPFPTARWFCLTWEFKYGGQGGSNTFLAQVDGATLDKGSFTGPDAEGQSWNAGPWKNLSLGWVGYGSSDVDIEEWIDDLAIGDAPIACPTPR